MATLVNTNLGGYRNKRRELHDELTAIQNTHGKIDVVTLQEYCDFNNSSLSQPERRVPPFFFHSPTTNETHASNSNHCRGVATYCNDLKHGPVYTGDLESEICVTLHEIRRTGRNQRGYRDTKVAIINVYNNHNIPDDTLLRDIQAVIRRCRGLHYHKFRSRASRQ